MEASPKEFVNQHIDAESFYQDYFPEWNGRDAVLCPFHEDTKPSLVIDTEGRENGQPGQFYCHSCGVKGTSCVDFYIKREEKSFYVGLWELYGKWVRPIVDPKIHQELHNAIMANDALMEEVIAYTRWTEQTIERFQIGVFRDYVTIPVFDQFGNCINIRFYNYKHKDGPKYYSYTEGEKGRQGFGKRAIFPPKNLEGSLIYILAGERDCLIAIQDGLNAVTVIGGEGTWDPSWNKLFVDKHVVIIYDVNDSRDKGQKGAKKIAMQILPFAKSVKRVILPLDIKGGDYTDYRYARGYPIEAFKDLVKDTAEIPRPAISSLVSGPDPTSETSLIEASSSDFLMKPVKMRCLVRGKQVPPYLIPRKIMVSCAQNKKFCNYCPIFGGSKEQFIRPDNPLVLKLIGVPESLMEGAIRKACGIPFACKPKIKVLEAANMETLILVPGDVFFSVGEGALSRVAYYYGHGLKTNQTYIFRGYTLPNPKNMEATQVLTSAEPTKTSIESFKLQDGDHEKLKIFESDNIEEKLNDIYTVFGTNVSRIYGRIDLHMAVDLVFHSCLEFFFNKEFVHRGWLDILVIGDTRTGKGQVAEGLIKYYKLGELVTGENCSYPGLVGGLQRMDHKWSITWGKIPLNDRRLVVIDEASAIDLRDIEKLSRVRSEGQAAIEKIEAETTVARTRLIWLSNPRSGRALNTYAQGVLAVMELMGKTEDVSRFDYAVSVATDEVDPNLINAIRGDSVPNPYVAELCRKLILWIWTRRPDQVLFTEECTKYILQQGSKKLADQFSTVIPLVQSENIRLKIARVAAAIAGRLHRTDITGKVIKVGIDCAEFAVKLLERFYIKDSMAYDEFSRMQFLASKLRDKSQVGEILDGLSDHVAESMILETEDITDQDLSDWAELDLYESKQLMGELVRQRALKRDKRWYRKTPAFIRFLKNRRRQKSGKG